MAAAEAADLALDPALLVGALQAGLAEERVEPVVASQRDEPLVLDSGAASQDADDRRGEVVVADPPRHPPEVGKRAHVSLKECLLGLVRERGMKRPARARQPHNEQPHRRQRPLQPDVQLAEVDLGLGTRPVGLRHRHHRDPTGQLPTHHRDVLANRRLADPRTMLSDQPLPDPPRGMPLLFRQLLVRLDPRADHRLPLAQHRRLPHRPLALGRDRAGKRLADRPPVHPMLPSQGTDPHPLPGIAADTLELLHPRHPFSSLRRCQQPRSVGPVIRGWGHLWRSNRPPVGPVQRLIPRASLPVVVAGPLDIAGRALGSHPGDRGSLHGEVREDAS